MNCYLVCILHVPVEVATRIWLTSYVFAAILQGVLIFQKVVGLNDLDYTKRLTLSDLVYSKVVSSRLVYYQILDHFVQWSQSQYKE